MLISNLSALKLPHNSPESFFNLEEVASVSAGSSYGLMAIPNLLYGGNEKLKIDFLISYKPTKFAPILCTSD